MKWAPARLFLFVLLLILAGCEVDLYTQLSEREANQMVAVLVEHGIPARKVRGADETLTVQVDEAQFAAAVDLLDGFGFPQDKYDTLGEVFADKGLVSSPIEERARLIYALSQELSQTVSEIDGVLSARVHVVLPADDSIKQNPVPSSASVVVHHYADRPLNAAIPQIKMLVANSVEGLVYDNVSVALFPVTPPQAIAETSTVATKIAGLGIDNGSAWKAQLVIYSLAVLALIALVGNGVQFWRRRR